MLGVAATLAAASWGCHGSGSSGEESSTDGGMNDGGDAEVVDGHVLLSPTEHLVRISMALRGKRPRVGDLSRVEDDPAVIEELVDEYLESDEFREVIRDLHNDALLVDAEIFELEPNGALQGESPTEIAESVLQGPLRLIENVVMEDAPYTEIVTADYWMVNEHSSVVWGTEYDRGGKSWQPVPIPDARPRAGILTDNGFYLRHESCGLNYNRGRAQLLTDALLCHDYLSADIDIDGSIDLGDPAAVATAVQTVGACMGCHQTLDPLASAMNGFIEAYFPDPPYNYPLEAQYYEDLADYWPEFTGREPAFFGKPVADLGELGQTIADDPRFSLCTATRFYSYLSQVPREDVPVDVASELQLVLEDADFSAKALVRHIVLSDEFKRASVAEDGDADPEALVGYKRARPFQLANLFEGLTDYEWRLDIHDIEPEDPALELDLARNAFVGFEVLAGGHDSFFQTKVTQTVNATTSLYVRELATRAASYVVDHDFGLDADDRKLLRLIEDGDTDEAAVRKQLDWLFLRIYGERVEPDNTDVDAAYAVFAGVLARTGESRDAWKATLTAMLSDLHIIYY